MGRELLLVGSVPLDTVEEVMRTFGGPLGRYLPAMPDGEVGERRSWVNRFSYLLFSGHADLETLRPGRPDEDAFGFTYADIDDFLEGRPVHPDIARAILDRYHGTTHKRALPVAPAY